MSSIKPSPVAGGVSTPPPYTKGRPQVPDHVMKLDFGPHPHRVSVGDRRTLAELGISLRSPLKHGTLLQVWMGTQSEAELIILMPRGDLSDRDLTNAESKIVEVATKYFVDPITSQDGTYLALNKDISSRLDIP